MERKPLATYLSLATEFYEFEEHRDHAQALSFYQEKASQAYGPILEPMCGSGRFMIPMLQAGYDSEGFDASPAMLEAFRKKYVAISKEPAPISQQFVQDFKSTKRYGFIFVPYGSWGLITNHQESQKSLLNLYNHLAPNGTLLIELEMIASLEQPDHQWRTSSHIRPDGSIISLTFRTDFNAKKQLFQANTIYELSIGNMVVQREEELFEQYLYRPDEFDQLLKEVGFEKIKKYPPFDPTQSVLAETPIIIYECTK